MSNDGHRAHQNYMLMGRPLKSMSKKSVSVAHQGSLLIKMSRVQNGVESFRQGLMLCSGAAAVVMRKELRTDDGVLSLAALAEVCLFVCKPLLSFLCLSSHPVVIAMHICADSVSTCITECIHGPASLLYCETMCVQWMTVQRYTVALHRPVQERLCHIRIIVVKGSP